MENGKIKQFAVFCSGNGALFATLINAVKAGTVPAEICCLIAGAPGIYAIELAIKNKIPYVVLNKSGFKDKNSYDKEILNILDRVCADFAVLAGFLSVLEGNTVNTYKNRIINVHPSLMYKFCGKGCYGKAVHRAVIDAGAQVSGATVHFVDQGIDTGPIILQKSLIVKKNDTADTLSMKVLRLESGLLIEAARLIAENRVQLINGRVKISGRDVNI